MENNILFQVRNLHKTFGIKKVLQGVDFSVKKGEILGLLGPNGTGKSTTIRSMLCLYGKPQGSVIFKGKDITSVHDIASEISYIPDEPVYYDSLTVLENIKLTAMLNKISKQDFTNKKEIITQRLQLEEYLDFLPDTLSKGTKQKLSIACGLIRDFSFMITDEPFEGLDPKQIRVLKDIFLEQKAAGKSILVSTHLLDLAETFCDRFVILYKGKVIAQGTPDEIRDKYSEELKSDDNMETIYLNVIEKLGRN